MDYHRVAISNNRILKLADGQVSFKWRDYRDSSKWKIMTLSAEEFIRRFLMHVLPQGFMKIRHFGFLSSREKQIKLQMCKVLTETTLVKRERLSTGRFLPNSSAESLPFAKAAALTVCFAHHFHHQQLKTAKLFEACFEDRLDLLFPFYQK